MIVYNDVYFNSWCVLRSQSLDANYKHPPQQTHTKTKEENGSMFASEDDWGDDVGELEDDFKISKVLEDETKKHGQSRQEEQSLNLEHYEIAVTEGALSNEFDRLTFQDGDKNDDQDNEKEDISIDDSEKNSDEMVIPDDSLHSQVFQMIGSNHENNDENSHDMEEEEDETDLASDILISYYLSVVEEESVQKEEDASYVKRLLRDYQRNEGVDLDGMISPDLPSR